jgi:hypothetical protein
MIPLPRFLFEIYAHAYGEQTTRLFFFPAPLGVL